MKITETLPCKEKDRGGGYMQGHPSMPDDFFRMLICGPSNSGKTNTLLFMIYNLLDFDKIFLFAKNLHQHKYQRLLSDFTERINPRAGYEVIESGRELIPMEELSSDNQKIVVFDDFLCERNQDGVINFFTNGRHAGCSTIYLAQTFFKTPKDIRDNCTHFCIFGFLPRENKRIASELKIPLGLFEKATAEPFSFLYLDLPKKTVKKNFDEDIA